LTIPKSQLQASAEEKKNTLIQMMQTDMDKEEDKIHKESYTKN
jgi:hypothetical protein